LNIFFIKILIEVIIVLLINKSGDKPMYIEPINTQTSNPMAKEEGLVIEKGYKIYDNDNEIFYDLKAQDFPESNDPKEVLAQICWSMQEPSDDPDDHPRFQSKQFFSISFFKNFIESDCRNYEEASISVSGVGVLNYMDCIQIWENPEMYLPVKDRISELKFMIKPGADAPTDINAITRRQSIFLEAFGNENNNFKSSTAEAREEFLNMVLGEMAEIERMGEDPITTEAIEEVLMRDECPIKIQKQHNYPHEVTIINNYFKSDGAVIYGTSIAKVMASKAKEDLDEGVHNTSLEEDGEENEVYVTDSVKEAYEGLENKEKAGKFMRQVFARKFEESGLTMFDENSALFRNELPEMEWSKELGKNKFANSVYTIKDFWDYEKDSQFEDDDGNITSFTWTGFEGTGKTTEDNFAQFSDKYKSSDDFNRWADDMLEQDWFEGNDETPSYANKVLEAYIEAMLKMDDYEGRVYKLANEVCGLFNVEILEYINGTKFKEAKISIKPKTQQGL
jgi:hypothetical protein